MHFLEQRNSRANREIPVHRQGHKPSDIQPNGRDLFQSSCREVGGQSRAITMARYKAITVSSSSHLFGWNLKRYESPASIISGVTSIRSPRRAPASAVVSLLEAVICYVP